MLDWLLQNSEHVKNILEFTAKFPDKANNFRQKAEKHWQVVSQNNPKYDLKEETEPEFLARVEVPVTKIAAKYQQVDKSGQKIGKWINRMGLLCSAEEIATEWYVSRGFTVLGCERKFISAWVATFLTSTIQDPDDPRVRQSFHGSTKGWTSSNRKTPVIEIRLPEDFGSVAYYDRRRNAIRASINQMSASDDLLGLFDKLLAEGESLRDYLWVNDDRAIEVARTALRILPKELVVACVGWAIQNFWRRQPGWPDLFAYNGTNFIFVEVKSPHDKLSREQMSWFQWAIEEGHIPCEICRVNRAKE